MHIFNRHKEKGKNIDKLGAFCNATKVIEYE